jgi:hypothetical protein
MMMISRFGRKSQEAAACGVTACGVNAARPHVACQRRTAPDCRQRPSAKLAGGAAKGILVFVESWCLLLSQDADAVQGVQTVAPH